MIDSLFIIALIVHGGYVFGLCFYAVLRVLSCFADHLDGKERAVCFTSIVSLVSCD